MTAGQLAELLRLDFRPAHFGEGEDEFGARLDTISKMVLKREATPAQQEAHARLLLVRSRLSYLAGQVEEQRAASGASIRRNLAASMASLRLDARALEIAAGLAQTRVRGGSVSVLVEGRF